MNKDIILTKLIKNQRNIELSNKLTFQDLKRVSSNLTTDIFGDECSIWNGYVTNLNHDKKNNYISFFYKNKKIALHRLLFLNYVDNLDNSEYLKFTCENKGRCCTLKHISKVSHKSTEKSTEKSTKSSIIDKNKVSF